MNVIAKISCYFERSVVILKLRKEYLNRVTYNTSALLGIKYWTVWYIERYSMSTYKPLRESQTSEHSRFFGPRVYYPQKDHGPYGDRTHDLRVISTTL